MTSDRAQAYGRVVATIEDLGPTKLQATEVERIRQAVDTLLFSETLDAPGAADLRRFAAQWRLRPRQASPRRR